MTLLMRDQEMIKKGRSEGRNKERTEIITQMLVSGKAPEEIAAFTGIPLTDIKEVEDVMLQKA